MKKHGAAVALRALLVLLGAAMTLRAEEPPAPPAPPPGPAAAPEAPALPETPTALADPRPRGAYPDHVLVETLDNGLELLVYEDHSKPLVSVRAIVKVGGMYEDEWLGSGLSHYMEHIVAGGTTARRSETESQEILKGIGKMTNASTWLDWTQYFITTQSEHLETTLDLIGDWLAHCQFTEREVAREQKVVQEELLRNQDNPSRELFYAWMQTRYREHPARVPVIGWQANIDRLTRDDMIAFYRRWYAPNNTVLAIVGDVDKAAARAAVARHFGGWERRSVKPVLLAPEPDQTALRWVEHEFGPTRNTLVRLGVPAPTLTHPDLYPLDLLAFIVGEGRSARLAQQLIFAPEGARVQSVSASSWTPTWGPGSFSIDFETANYEDAAGLVWDIWDELQRFTAEPVSAEELARAKKMKEREFYQGRQTFDDLSSSMGHNLASIGDPLFDERYVANIQQVTAEQIMQAARRYFLRDRLTVVMVKPRAAPEAAEVAPTPPAADSSQPGGGPAGRPPAAGVRAARLITLDNGLRLVLKPTPGAGAVSVAARLGGGLCWETEAEAGLFHLLASTWIFGSQEHPFPQIFAELDQRGVSLAPVARNDFFGLNLWCLKDDLDWSVALLADLIRQPQFHPGQFENSKRRLTVQLAQMLADGDLQAALMMKKALFAAHPYRRWRMGSAETLAALTRDQVRAAYQRVAVANNLVISVVGDFDADAAEALLRARFADLPAGETPTFAAPQEPPLEARAEFAANDQGRTNYYLSFRGVDRAHPDFFALEVIDSVISGVYYPSGWLHEALRGGDANLVYSIHALNAPGSGAGYFYVVTDFQPGNYDRVHGIIAGVMDRIAAGPVEAGELERAKAEAVSSFNLQRRDNSADAAGLAEDELVGLGFQWPEKYAAGIKAVDSDRALAVAKQYFAVRTLSVVYPADQPEPGRAAAPAGPDEGAAPGGRGAGVSPAAEAEIHTGETPVPPDTPASSRPEPGKERTEVAAPSEPDLVISVTEGEGALAIVIGAGRFTDRAEAVAHLRALDPRPRWVRLVHDQAADSLLAAAYLFEACVDREVPRITRELHE